MSQRDGNCRHHVNEIAQTMFQAWSRWEMEGWEEGMWSLGQTEAAAWTGCLKESGAFSGGQSWWGTELAGYSTHHTLLSSASVLIGYEESPRNPTARVNSSAQQYWGVGSGKRLKHRAEFLIRNFMVSQRIELSLSQADLVP